MKQYFVNHSNKSARSLLNFKPFKFNTLSLERYDEPDMPGILLVNFLCTDSMEIMSFFSVGSHTGLLYSRIETAIFFRHDLNSIQPSPRLLW